MRSTTYCTFIANILAAIRLIMKLVADRWSLAIIIIFFTIDTFFFLFDPISNCILLTINSNGIQIFGDSHCLRISLRQLRRRSSCWWWKHFMQLYPLIYISIWLLLCLLFFLVLKIVAFFRITAVAIISSWRIPIIRA